LYKWKWFCSYAVQEMKRYSCVNMADWSKTRPTATPRGPNTIKISQTEKSQQLTFSWWSKCYILNNLRVLHHIICLGELARGFVKENSLVCEMCNFTHQRKTKKRQYIYYTKPNTETKLGIRNSTYMYTITLFTNRTTCDSNCLSWLIRYMCYWNLQLLNSVIINKAKVFLPHA